MTKPQPWELFRFLDEKWKYLAMNASREWYLYDIKPILKRDGSWYPKSYKKNCGDFLKFNFENDWKDSLFSRDDYAEQLGEGGDKSSPVENKPVKKKISLEFNILHHQESDKENWGVRISRVKVIGGWIYCYYLTNGNFTNTFIPDPNHEWEIDSDETTGENDV